MKNVRILRSVSVVVRDIVFRPKDDTYGSKIATATVPTSAAMSGNTILG